VEWPIDKRSASTALPEYSCLTGRANRFVETFVNAADCSRFRVKEMMAADLLDEAGLCRELVNRRIQANKIQAAIVLCQPPVFTDQCFTACQVNKVDASGDNQDMVDFFIFDNLANALLYMVNGAEVDRHINAYDLELGALFDRLVHDIDQLPAGVASNRIDGQGGDIGCRGFR